MTSKEQNISTPDRDSTTPTNSPHQLETKSAWGKKIRENALTMGVALILALIIRIFIAEPRYIPSDSMVPTLIQGDRLVVEKVTNNFHLRPIIRGDIVVFQPPFKLQVLGYKTNQAFIKRAIATPGETVAVEDGIVYINHQPLTEDYIAEVPQYNLNSLTVPPGQLFVMGDNRNNSNDSHIWGFLPQENIIGRAVFRFWPLARIGNI